MFAFGQGWAICTIQVNPIKSLQCAQGEGIFSEFPLSFYPLVKISTCQAENYKTWNKLPPKNQN